MKKINFLKSIAVAAMFMVAGSGAFAQSGSYAAFDNVGATDYASPGPQASDTVALGARMPYYVAPDANIAALVGTYLKASTFKWDITDNSDVTLAPAMLKYDGTAATAATPATNGFVENEISFLWPSTLTAGVYKVKVTEHTNPLVGVGCDGTASSRLVVVQALPTVTFPSDKAVACSASTVDLPLTLSGSSPWKVSYTITRLSGTPTPKVVTDQVVSSGKNSYVASNTTLTLPVDLTGVTGGSGDYTVTINVIKDRITDKALNSLSNPVSASNVFTVKIISPATNPIQHVKNL